MGSTRSLPTIERDLTSWADSARQAAARGDTHTETIAHGHINRLLTDWLAATSEPAHQ